MAWNSHPQGRMGYVWIHQPTVVFEAEWDSTNTYANGQVSGEDIYQYLYVTNITTGALADLEDGMTLSLGSAAQGWDYGFCRVRGVTNVSGTDVILVWINGTSNQAGDLAFGGGTRYVTVWKEYRLWSKPPYYDSSGVGWFDGNQSNGVGGVNYNYYPVANGGPPVMGWVDSSGVLSVDFDASRSFRTERLAVIGAWSSDLAPGSTITSSSENGGNVDDNVVDGNNTTYWEPTSLPAWIMFTMAADQRVLGISIIASGTDAPRDFVLEVQDGVRGASVDMNEILDLSQETGWGTNETRTWYLDVDYVNEYWGEKDSAGQKQFRLWITADNGGTLRIKEVKLYAEDRTSGTPYTWDFDGGTVTTGTTSSEAPTVEFDPGFYYVSLTVEDSLNSTDVHWIPVLALGTKYVAGSEISYSGATTEDSHPGVGLSVDNLFDNDLSSLSAWTNDVNTLPETATITLASEETIGSYSISFARSFPEDYAPKAWNVYYKYNDTWILADAVTNQTGWTNPETRSFTLDRVTTAQAWRLEITEGPSGVSVWTHEWNLIEYTVDAQELPLTNVQVMRRDLDISGQTLEIIVHEDMSSYPEGALVMYGETERRQGVAVPPAQAEYDLVDRAYLKWWGWLGVEYPEHRTAQAGSITQTRIICEDIGKRLQKLPGWNLVFQRENTPSYSYEFRNPNLDRMIWFVARHISNAVNLTDFFWSGTLDWYGVGVSGLFGTDLYSMMAERAKAGAFTMGVNRFGQLLLKKDQNLTYSTFRNTTSHADLSESDYTDFRWEHSKQPRYGNLFLSGIQVYLAEWTVGGFNIVPFFTQAPYQVPVQGAQTMDQGEMLASIDYAAEYRTYGSQIFENRLNPIDANAVLTLCVGNDAGFDPAEQIYFTVDLGASYAAERGQTFSDQKFFPVRVTFTYDNLGCYATQVIQAEKYYWAPYIARNYTP